MASIEDIKKLLESKSFTSARDLDELEEKPDDKQNEVRLNCDPMVGMMEEEGKIFLNSVRFSKAWNSLGKDIPIAELIIVGKVKVDIRETYNKDKDVRIEDSKE